MPYWSATKIVKYDSPAQQEQLFNTKDLSRNKSGLCIFEADSASDLFDSAPPEPSSACMHVPQNPAYLSRAAEEQGSLTGFPDFYLPDVTTSGNHPRQPHSWADDVSEASLSEVSDNNMLLLQSSSDSTTEMPTLQSSSGSEREAEPDGVHNQCMSDRNQQSTSEGHVVLEC